MSEKKNKKPGGILKKITDNTEGAIEYYDRIWSNHFRTQTIGEELLPGFHYGFFEKGVKTLNDAMYNMNDFVSRLLDLEENKTMEILDVGCGTGCTSLYLAERYPNSRFSGISLAPNEIALAKKFAKNKNIDSTKFILGNYLDTRFQDGSFDAIYALESMSYAIDKKAFVNEMYRILKSNGRLAIIDGFRKDIPLTCIMKKIYDSHLKTRGRPDLASLSMFKTYLKEIGFKDIEISNISKNIRRHFISSLFNSLTGFSPSMIKADTKNEKHASKRREYRYVSMRILLDSFFGLVGISTFNSITAIKK